jgi:hypothetical protein
MAVEAEQLERCRDFPGRSAQAQVEPALAESSLRATSPPIPLDETN